MATSKQYSTFPINPRYSKIWELYLKSVDSYWTTNEIDLSKDRQDWNELNSSSQHFIKKILAFFATSDGLVNENIGINFFKEFDSNEIRSFYSQQMAIESIHNHMYSLLIETFISDEEEKIKLLNSSKTDEILKEKTLWALEWADHSKPLEQRIIAYCAIEGIFFSSSFAAIFWIKEQNILPGLTKSNEFISRDEGMHTDAGCLIYKTLTPLEPTTVYTIIDEAVKIEKKFIQTALPQPLININADQLSQYVEFIADRLCRALGYEDLYLVKNPLKFMDNISMDIKTNFFESRATEYKKTSTLKKEDIAFNCKY